jgi:predicted nucleotide-binding protein
VLRVKSKGLSTETKALIEGSSKAPVHVQSKKVFVVHGHDSEVKESVARFIERLGLEPIILHEQPNSGRTLIEKFEVFSDVGFAVVLLTPDDVGASTKDKENLKGRARQNVVLELGYFTGKLGRRRVCPLYRRDVQIPSDFQGVIYTEIDAGGAWKTKLAQELVEAGFSIDLNALLKG